MLRFAVSDEKPKGVRGYGGGGAAAAEGLPAGTVREDSVQRVTGRVRHDFQVSPFLQARVSEGLLSPAVNVN